jgi:hypothetical protein
MSIIREGVSIENGNYIFNFNIAKREYILKIHPLFKIFYYISKILDFTNLVK